MQTFAEFCAAVRRTVNPDGFSSRLTAAHKNWIRDFLIDLQVSVVSLQQGHRETIPFSATMFSCGASGFSAPHRSLVREFRVEHNTDCCDFVTADHIAPGILERLMQSWKPCGTATTTAGDDYEYGTADYSYPDLPDCLKFSAEQVDLPCRARNRWWTAQGGYLWTYPRINSTENVVLVWNGIIRSWKDETAIPWLDEAGDTQREIVSLAEDFLRWKNAKFIDCDMTAAESYEGDFLKNRATLICIRKQEERPVDSVRYYPMC